MTTTEFIIKAKGIVAKQCGTQSFLVNPVWLGYVLGNMKGIFITPDSDDDDMYEVTYNRAKEEMYVDRYGKVSNTLYKIEDLL